MGSVREAQEPIREADLQRWRLMGRFQEVLSEKALAWDKGTWGDPRRRLELGNYLGLYLFGLFNPVVTTMRGLCAASRLGRVQAEICGRAVSLGSFSEAQAVVAPELLEAVFAELRPSAPAAREQPTLVIDSTVWRVLPRMTWAFWRAGRGEDNAIRMHVQFDLQRRSVAAVEVTRAKVCERAQWRKWAQPGSCYIGDRYYSYDYDLLGQLQARGVDFLVRLRLDAQWVQEQEQRLTASDRAAGVTWAGLVQLGVQGDGPRVRVIQIMGEDESILLATTLAAEVAPPEVLAQTYKHRWQVELFFRWFKCILGCRHWLAESPRGVALQVYLALIAAQLLLLYTGQRPTKRQMEAIQFYQLGWASAEELVARVSPPAPKKS